MEEEGVLDWEAWRRRLMVRPISQNMPFHEWFWIEPPLAISVIITFRRNCTRIFQSNAGNKSALSSQHRKEVKSPRGTIGIKNASNHPCRINLYKMFK